jgi:hypothetical protein
MSSNCQSVARRSGAREITQRRACARTCANLTPASVRRGLAPLNAGLGGAAAAAGAGGGASTTGGFTAYGKPAGPRNCAASGSSSSSSGSYKLASSPRPAFACGLASTLALKEPGGASPAFGAGRTDRNAESGTTRSVRNDRLAHAGGTGTPELKVARDCQPPPGVRRYTHARQSTTRAAGTQVAEAVMPARRIGPLHTCTLR